MQVSIGFEKSEQEKNKRKQNKCMRSNDTFMVPSKNSASVPQLWIGISKGHRCDKVRSPIHPTFPYTHSETHTNERHIGTYPRGIRINDQWLFPFGQHNFQFFACHLFGQLFFFGRCHVQGRSSASSTGSKWGHPCRRQSRE